MGFIKGYATAQPPCGHPTYLHKTGIVVIVVTAVAVRLQECT